MVITALPVLRRINYNTFYFLHITLSFFVIVLICIHASTDFYCILPGLLLYVYDIIWRLRCSLAHKAEVEIEAGGDGWYSVVLPPVAAPKSDARALEKGTPASPPPLQTYYLNIPSISKVEVHAFTATTAGTEGVRPRLLLRKSPARKLAKKSDKEWTWKLATLADSAPTKTSTIARIEGPYAPSTPGLYAAERMLCLVAGTGISGALSLTKWWTQQEHSSAQAMSRLIWTVRSREQCPFPDLLEVQTLIQQHSNMELIIHVSGESGRLDLNKAVEGFLLGAVSGWVYICGPEQFSAQADQACWSAKQSLNKQDRHALTWYNSSYAV